METVKIYADVPENIAVANHAFDYFDFTTEELCNAAFNATEAYVTPKANHILPIIIVTLRNEVYALAIATHYDDEYNEYYTEVVTVLTAEMAYRNIDNHNRFHTEPANLEFV